MNPGGGGCSEPRSRHCTPAWVTRVKLHLKKKKGSEKKVPFSLVAFLPAVVTAFPSHLQPKSFHLGKYADLSVNDARPQCRLPSVFGPKCSEDKTGPRQMLVGCYPRQILEGLAPKEACFMTAFNQEIRGIPPLYRPISIFYLLPCPL